MGTHFSENSVVHSFAKFNISSLYLHARFCIVTDYNSFVVTVYNNRRVDQKLERSRCSR